MRLSSLIPATLLAFSSLVIAADAESDVISLTSDNFEKSVKKEDLMLVEFFAPWCGHCKALAPHYEEAATTLKEKNIKLAKVDCVDQADLCQSHGVQGYPTLKVFRNGTPTDYNGPRKADGIVSYMVKQSLPAVNDVGANHDEFVKSDKLVVVAYAKKDEPVSKEFAEVAQSNRDDYLFGHVTDADVTAAAGVTPPQIVVYRTFDDERTEYPLPAKGAKARELEEWIQELSIPVIDEVNGENYGLYASSEKPLAYLFIDRTQENFQEQIDAIRPIAKEFKGKMNFVWIDAVKFADHGKALNLHEAKWPAFVIQDVKKQLKYPMSQGEQVTPTNVQDWVERYLKKELKPELKSEPIPDSQDEPVFVLVGKQFDEVVFDDSKDVFLELYASWCGHCKRLKPTWDQLGEHFAPIKDRVTIAKMEAQQNDLPPSAPFRVAGFPTLKFKPAGSKEFLDYEGDRSLESLVSFVEENAKNDLTFPPPTEKVETEGDGKQAPISSENATEGGKHDEL
ncbi:thioredoxin-like domain-containing protein [Schizophyllum commune]